MSERKCHPELVSGSCETREKSLPGAGILKRVQDDIFLCLLMLLTIFFSFPAYANFGESCRAPAVGDGTGYLTTNTAYGYLLQNIDMKTNISDGCTQGDDVLRFCIRNNTASPICTPAQINAGSTVNLSDISTNPDIGGNPLLADIQLSADILDNSLCLQMLTSRGKVSLVCRDYNVLTNVTGPESEVCQNLGSSCYDGRTKSQSLLSFSGITVNCVRQTLDKVFYTGNECPQVEQDIHFTFLSPFPAFQGAMRLAIGGALILYVMFYGFKVVLNHEYVELNKVALFVLKFIFVVYFSVGFGQDYNQYGRPVKHNGMTETVLPMLLQMTSDFTEIVFMSGGSQGLCKYDVGKYPAGYEFYKVWDAIDCRIGYYFGMQLLYNMGNMFGLNESGSSSTGGDTGSAANFGNEGSDGIDALKNVGGLTFFVVMFGFFMAGNIIIVLCGMIFAVMFISVIFYFLSAYLVSMVTLYVMAYISPIFIPMLLFERTKAYFDSWLKIVISCALQPAVIGGFIALLLTMYDSVFFGNCEYLRHDYETSGFNFSTFEIREPSSEPEKCINSIGYKLVKYYKGQGWEKKIIIIFEIVKVNDFLDLGLSMVYMLIYVFIFYFALQSINDFISDLTGGPSMAAVTFSPTAIMDKAMSAASKAGSAISMGKGGGKPEMPGKSRGGGATDKISTGGGGGGGVADKISTGGGGGGK